MIRSSDAIQCSWWWKWAKGIKKRTRREQGDKKKRRGKKRKQWKRITSFLRRYLLCKTRLVFFTLLILVSLPHHLLFFSSWSTFIAQLLSSLLCKNRIKLKIPLCHERHPWIHFPFSLRKEKEHVSYSWPCVHLLCRFCLLSLTLRCMHPLLKETSWSLCSNFLTGVTKTWQRIHPKARDTKTTARTCIWDMN